MPETVGQGEDQRAFEQAVWDKLWAPKSGEPIHLTIEQMAQMNPRLALRHAFGAGRELEREKRGCLHPNCGECNGGEDGGEGG